MSGLHHGHGHDHGRGGTRAAVTVTLVVNAAITVAKWAAFALTGSPSLFGEAAHSTADALNPLVLWFGERRSRRPADARHPLGHGREAFFWSLVAAEMMLAIGAALTARHGIETIVRGETPHLSRVAIVILALSALGECYALATVWRRLRKDAREGVRLRETRNPILLGLLVECGTDVLGIALAFGGYGMYMLTGSPLWDAVFSLAIAALLAVSSLFLINRSRSLIIGESAPPEVERAVMRLLRQRQSVAEVRRVVTVMRSPEDIGCMIVLRWDAAWFTQKCAALAGGGAAPTPVAWALAVARTEAEAIKADVHALVPEITQVGIEIT